MSYPMICTKSLNSQDTANESLLRFHTNSRIKHVKRKYLVETKLRVLFAAYLSEYVTATIDPG